MAESILVIADHAGEELHELKRKFHPQHDYLNLIIPSTWLAIGVLVADFYFYDAEHLKNILRHFLHLEEFFHTASTSLEFFLALLLFVGVFTVIYVVGQMINGLSALLLDRLIVKKLLKYPFELYQIRESAAADIADRTLFRNLVLQSSYLVYCLNLLPLIFLELVATLFSFRSDDLRDGVNSHAVVAASILFVVLYVHFGLPTLKKPRRYPEDDVIAKVHYENCVGYHVLFLAVTYFVLLFTIVGLGWVFTILALPITNLLIGIAERYVRVDEDYPSKHVRRFYFYLRLCFTNPIYFAAKLVGYGDVPSASVIRDARSAIGPGCDDKDFFWFTYLVVQNHGGAASQTAYHFLAMYGMVRNLCNATALILVFSVVTFWVDWPANHGMAVVGWCVGLCILMYALFARYLYVYASYFSKYVLRVAAHVYRGTRRLTDGDGVMSDVGITTGGGAADRACRTE